MMPDWLKIVLLRWLVFAIGTALVGWLVWNGIQQLRVHDDVLAAIYFAAAAIIAARVAPDTR